MGDKYEGHSRLWKTNYAEWQAKGNVISEVDEDDRYDPDTSIHRPIEYTERSMEDLRQEHLRRRNPPPLDPSVSEYQKAKRTFDTYQDYPKGPCKIEDDEVIGTKYWEMRLACEKLINAIESYRLVGGAFLPLDKELSKVVKAYTGENPRKNAFCSGWCDLEEIYARSNRMKSEWEDHGE